MIKGEALLHQQVCDYLRHQYPQVIFRTDFSAGARMTMGQAVKHKRLQSDRAYPDLFIAYPTEEYHGLFIELKADGVTVYKKNGELTSNPHIKEQEAMLERLRGLGYRASFAKGFKEAKELIDDYLKDVPLTDMQVLRMYQTERNKSKYRVAKSDSDGVLF